MRNVDNKVVVSLFFKELKIHKQKYKQPDRNMEHSFPGACVDHHARVRILRMHCPL